jgi:hypothetical protein
MLLVIPRTIMKKITFEAYKETRELLWYITPYYTILPI